MCETLVKTDNFKDSPLGKIPKDWDVKTLDSITSKIIDGTHFTPTYVEYGMPFLRVIDIHENTIDFNNVKRITIQEHHQLTSRCNPQVGDILYSKNGTVGITKVVDWQQEFSIFVSLCLIRPITTLVNPLYLSRILQSFLIEKQIRIRTKQMTVINLHLEEIREFLIPLPHLDEQHRIAEILDTVDETIALTSSLIAKLKQIKAGLLHDLLTRGLDENGELRDAIAHPEQFKDSPLGQIPKHWEVAPLKVKQNLNFPYIKTGPFGSSLKGEHWVEDGVPVITIGSIGEGKFIKSELLFISEAKARSLSSYVVKEGDLVFSRVADVGRSVVVSEAEDGWIMSSNLMRISLDRTLVYPTFAYLNIVHNEFTRRQIRQFVNSGGREIANTAVLDSLLFCWSSKKEQLTIAKAASIYDTRIYTEEAYLNKLKLQKQGLMHDLLTGKVRVNEIKQ